jgi:hypothetical protein
MNTPARWLASSATHRSPADLPPIGENGPQFAPADADERGRLVGHAVRGREQHREERQHHRGEYEPPGGRVVLITFTYTPGAPFTDRALSLDAMPEWVASDVQRWAVRPLLDESRTPEIDRRNKAKNKADARVRPS